MPGKKTRIIIDTNLWISFLLTKEMATLDLLFLSGRITILFSDELLDEFITVAARPKFKKYFKEADLHELLTQIHTTGELVKVKSTVTICRDAKDNFLLSLAKDGKASYQVTGDKDLLELNKVGKTGIVTVKVFLKILA